MADSLPVADHRYRCLASRCCCGRLIFDGSVDGGERGARSAPERLLSQSTEYGRVIVSNAEPRFGSDCVIVRGRGDEL